MTNIDNLYNGKIPIFSNMELSWRFEWYLFRDYRRNPFPKISQIIDREFWARSQTEDPEILGLIEGFKAERGEYTVVVTRTFEAVTCIVLNAIIAYEDSVRDRASEFHFSPSHINDDIRHGVDAVVYRRNNTPHPPKFEPIAWVDFTVSNEKFKEKKKDVLKKWWTRWLYFNGNGGIINLPHIVLYHHMNLIHMIMVWAEGSEGIRTYRDLQSFVVKSINQIFKLGYGGEFNIAIHLNHGKRIWVTPNHVIAMNRLLGRGD